MLTGDLAGAGGHLSEHREHRVESIECGGMMKCSAGGHLASGVVDDIN